MTILLLLKSIHYLLASEGFKVRPFNKAADFLAHAGTHHVPIVVTDIWMDEVTGLELLARLCAISPRTIRRKSPAATRSRSFHASKAERNFARITPGASGRKHERTTERD